MAETFFKMEQRGKLNECELTGIQDDDMSKKIDEAVHKGHRFTSAKCLAKITENFKVRNAIKGLEAAHIINKQMLYEYLVNDFS